MLASYSSFSSEDLIKACVGSDNEAAWTEFVRRFRPVIAKVVLRATRRWTHPQPHLLDDLIQDTFLKLCADHCLVLRRFESLHKDAVFGFLKSVAASVVCDHFKFQRARKRDMTQTEALSDQVRSAPAVSRADGNRLMEDTIALRQIDEMLCRSFSGDSLIRNRTIFWLHHRDGMTASAIAAIPAIGLNTKGVESTLRRMTLMIQSHIGSDI